MKTPQNPKGGGRKPIEDKLKPITTYVRQSTIDKLGRDNIQFQINELARKLDTRIPIN